MPPTSKDGVPPAVTKFGALLHSRNQGYPAKQLTDVEEFDVTEDAWWLHDMAKSTARFFVGTAVEGKVLPVTMASFVNHGVWLDSSGMVCLLVAPEWKDTCSDAASSVAASSTSVASSVASVASSVARDEKLVLLYPRNFRHINDCNVESAWGRARVDALTLAMDESHPNMIDLTMDE